MSLSKDPRQWIQAGGLVALLLLGIVFTTTTGGPLDAANEAHNLQHGTATVTIPAGQIDGTTDVFFPNAYSTLPRIMVSFNETTDPIPFLAAAQDGIIPVTSPGTTNTWVAMPAAQTELFGTTSNRLM